MLQVGYLFKEYSEKLCPVFLLQDKDLVDPKESNQVFCAPFLNDILELVPNKEINVTACTTRDFKQLKNDEVLIGDITYNITDFKVYEEDPFDDSDEWQLEGKKSSYKKVMSMMEDEL